MKRALNLCAVILLATFALNCPLPHSTQSGKQAAAAERSPFTIQIVPTESQAEPFGREIMMAKSAGEFYVVLTNISEEPQSVFKTSNSWGYQAISFQLRLPDGRTVTISKVPENFTKNFPAVFIIPPGEQEVFAITLDDTWNAVPTIPIPDSTSLAVTIKAVYELTPTPESERKKVWTGRLESAHYNFKLRHW